MNKQLEEIVDSALNVGIMVLGAAMILFGCFLIFGLVVIVWHLYSCGAV